MTIKLQDLYGGKAIRGLGNPSFVTSDEDDSLLAYIKMRRETDILNIEVLRAHKDDIRQYEKRRLAYLQQDLEDCQKAIAMLTGDFN